MSLTVTVAPTSEPLDLTTVKTHLRLVGSEEDVLLLNLIKSTRMDVENRTGRSLLTQTLALTLDDFPPYTWDLDWAWKRAAIALPRPPLQAVTSITYLDQAGVTQTLAATEYQVVSKTEPASIIPAYGKTWPVPRVQPECVTITYRTGWTTAADIPFPIKQTMLLLIGHLYENREAVTLDGRTPQTLPLAVQSLLLPYTILEAA